MAKARIEIGPDGARVVERITTQRKVLGLSQGDVSARLADIGRRPMSAAVIGEIERGARRVDVDDLFALADVLEVSPEWLIASDQKSQSLLEEVQRAETQLRIERAVTEALPARLEEAERRFEERLSANLESILSKTVARAIEERERRGND